MLATKSAALFSIAFVMGLILFSAPSMTSPAHGQTISSKPVARERVINAAREIMAAARYCALITVDATGRAHARTLDPFAPDEQMVVWLATNPRSRKVAEIRRNPRVTLYYFDREGQGYVTVYGGARLVNDPQEKTKRWKTEWQAFYPDREKDYLLIAVTPERMEVVSETKGIAGDSKTWRPPAVSFPRSKSR
jgi:general stress protein 26